MDGYQHETGTIIGKGGIELFFQCWRATKPIAALIIVHGLGEHSGRYGNLINWLKGKRISIYAIDHRGHGLSFGKRGHVEQFSDYVTDLSFFVNAVRDENPTIHIFLLGHSMGGVISILYALQHQNAISGLILSSPGFTPIIDVSPLMHAFAQMMSKYFPSFQTSNKIDANYLSHHRQVVLDYLNDPLVHNRISARWFTEFIKSAKECLRRASEITLPFLIIHGTDDRIVDFEGSIQFYDAASSRDKTKLLMEGLYHETLNEVEHEREKVLAAITKWLCAHSTNKNIAKKKKKSK